MSGQYSYPDPDPRQGRDGDTSETAGSNAVYFLVVLALVASLVLCVAGFFVARVLLDREPADLPGMITATVLVPTTNPGLQVTVPVTVPPGPPGQPALAISPQQGYINTLISVAGRDWWPGEPVFVFLRAPSEEGDRGYAYAAAVADDEGNVRAAFTFPNEMRWMGESWAEVIARGSRSALEASTRFDLVAPTAPPTLPPPTPLPTRLPMESPSPTAPLFTTPTATPTPTFTPAPLITDWLGEYFVGTQPGGPPALVRNDVTIDFNWGVASPDPRLPDDGFSARWTRQLNFPAGYYRFHLSSDDGLRLWIDGQLVVDQWNDGVLEDYTVTIYMTGGPHALRLEYYEHLGGAMVRLDWREAPAPTVTSTPTTTATPTPTVTPPSETATPTPTLSPTPTPTPPPSGNPLPGVWHGEYYANRFFENGPVYTRDDGAISFDWGTGGPEGLPGDDFSVRWTGEQWMPAGTYIYRMAVDEGARLWIDGYLVLEIWDSEGGGLAQGSIQVGDGVHQFRVDYYEASGRARIGLVGVRE